MSFTTRSSDQGVAGPAVPGRGQSGRAAGSGLDRSGSRGQSGRCRGTPSEHSALPDSSDDLFHIAVTHPPGWRGQNGRCFPTPSVVKRMTRSSSNVICQNRRADDLSVLSERYPVPLSLARVHRVIKSPGT